MNFTSGLDLVLDFLSNGITRASAWQVVIATLVMTHITIAGNDLLAPLPGAPRTGSACDP